MTDTHEAPAEPMNEQLFIDFANRVGLAAQAGVDPRGDAEALSRWLESANLGRGLPRRRLEAEVDRFRELRALVRRIGARRARGEPPTRAQVAEINRVMRQGVHYHALRIGDRGTEFRMEPVGDELAQARSSVAGSLAHYLAEHDAGRLRVCANDTCGWLFVDRSPAGRRRWCEMRTCGNRAKVARHRQRARSLGAGHGWSAPGG